MGHDFRGPSIHHGAYWNHNANWSTTDNLIADRKVLIELERLAVPTKREKKQLDIAYAEYLDELWITIEQVQAQIARSIVF